MADQAKEFVPPAEVADSAEKILELIADKEKLVKYCNMKGKPPSEYFEMNLPYCLIADLVKKELEAIGQHIKDDVEWRWEHVGSTSIPGMPGTWYPDALLLVPSFPPPASVLTALLNQGFHLAMVSPLDTGDLWFFKDFQEDAPLGHIHTMTIHLVQEDNHAGQLLLACRDRCRTDLWAFNNYKEKKIEASKKDFMSYKMSKGDCQLIKDLRKEFAIKLGSMPMGMKMSEEQS